MAKRLRGAGRITVDDGPVEFSQRHAKFGTVDPKARQVSSKISDSVDERSETHRIALLPLADVDINVDSGKKNIKRAAKMMDFRTPKAMPNLARTTIDHENSSPVQKSSCAGYESRRTSPIEPPTMCPDPSTASALFPSYEDSMGTPGIGFSLEAAVGCSTPETVPANITETRITAPLSATGHTDRKRKLDETDLQVPVQISPIKKVKKRLRGLLRELGPGASRFIIGAPNFATPARPKNAMPSTIDDYARIGSRRLSRRLAEATLSSAQERSHLDFQDLKAQESQRIKSAMTKKQNKSQQSKETKICIVCSGTKAWRRWHSTTCGSWRCNKCQKKSATLAKRISTPAGTHMNVDKQRTRTAHKLSEEELIHLLVRRRQGATFSAIATELKKWKTGQSVKNYLNKPEIQALVKSLSDRIETGYAASTKPCQKGPFQDNLMLKEDGHAILKSATALTTDKTSPISMRQDDEKRDEDDLDVLCS